MSLVKNFRVSRTHNLWLFPFYCKWHFCSSTWFSKHLFNIRHTLDSLLCRILNLGSIDILSQIFLVVRACPEHCKMFSSIHDLYLLEAISSIPPSCDNPKYFKMLLNVPRMAKSYLIEDHFLEGTSVCAVIWDCDLLFQYFLEVMLFGIYPNGLKNYVYTKTCTWVFIEPSSWLLKLGSN